MAKQRIVFLDAGSVDFDDIPFFLTIHTPHADLTQGLIGREAIGKMGKG